MVVPEELNKRTVSNLGVKHIYWLDNQTMNVVMGIVMDPVNLNLRPYYDDYLRARMNLPKLPGLPDIKALQEMFPSRSIKVEGPMTEDNVLSFIRKNYRGQWGANWRDLVKNLPEGWNRIEFEETISDLLDKGDIYEPMIGTLKLG